MHSVDIRDLSAADVMQRKVVTLAPEDSLRSAVQQMTEHYISGLPVVTDRGKCVGVISATDFVRYEHAHAEDTAAVTSFFNPDTQNWESIFLGRAEDELPETPVSEVMSSDLLSVKPETPLIEAASLMNFRQVHRILVLDDEGHLQGLLSAMDFVRMFAEGVE